MNKTTQKELEILNDAIEKGYFKDMEEIKRTKKIDRIVKQIIEIKDEISKLQDNLQLRFDKLRDLDVNEWHVDDYGNIKEVTSTRATTDIKELAKEVGQEVIDKFTKVTESTFYRVTTDKKFYER